MKHRDMAAGVVLHVSHEEFIKIIVPVLPRNTQSPHMMAVLKRTNILVNAGKLVIFRQASQNENLVPCLVMEKPVDDRKKLRKNTTSSTATTNL